MGCCNSVLMNFFLGVLMFCFALVFWMTFVLGILVPFNVWARKKKGKKADIVWNRVQISGIEIVRLMGTILIGAVPQSSFNMVIVMNEEKHTETQHTRIYMVQ